METISLAEAKALGLTHYYTGKPCRNHHLVKRQVSNRACVTCARERTYRHRDRLIEEDPNWSRKRMLKYTYGITEDDVEAMLTEQSGACATCDKPFAGKPHIDHCHATGAIRGLLCGPCNRALGMVKDRVATLQSMVAYLQRNG